MRGLSPHTIQLVRALKRQLGFWDALCFWRHGPISIIKKIAKANEPAALPSLIRYLGHADKWTRQAAANAMHALLRHTDPLDYVWLDVHVRRLTNYDDWFVKFPRKLSKSLRYGVANPSILCLACCHSNGRIREAAVRLLSDQADGIVWPFLLIRANDWVAEVQRAANRALQERLTVDQAPHIICNLQLVARLTDCQRTDQSRFIEDVYGLLMQPESREALAAGVASTDKFVQRKCYELLAEGASKEDLEALIHDALESEDQIVRLRAVRQARERLSESPLNRVLARARSDRSVPVRREVLAAFNAGEEETALSELHSALLDVHPSIRDFARFHSARRKSLDFLAFYKNALTTMTSPAAVAGLAECGGESEADLLVGYCKHSSARIRRAAVCGLGKIGGKTHVSQLIEGLRDDRPSVTHAARSALLRLRRLVDPPAIVSVFDNDTRAHVRIDALKILNGLGKWHSLPCLVRAASSQERSFRERGSELLGEWFVHANREQLAPTSDQLSTARITLDEVTGWLDRGLREDVDSMLVWWEKRGPHA